MEPKIIGLQIAKVVIDFQVHLHLGAQAEYELQIEADFVFRTPAKALLHPSGDSFSDFSAELESMVGATVITAGADETHGLTLELDSGAGISVPVDKRYEAWRVVGPGGYRVISLPGGELAVWSALPQREPEGARERLARFSLRTKPAGS